MKISLSPRWLVVRFDREHEVLSSAIVGGGLGRTRTVAWHEVHNDELLPTVDPQWLLRRRLSERGLSASVGLLTSRDVGRYVVAERRRKGISARVVATVGLGNAVRVGDPPGLRGRVGTINILCRVSEPLSREARIEALSVVAEARTLAVLEGSVKSGRTGLPSTGTGTDCIVIASPPGRRQTPYAGKHTAVGSAVGAAVLEALRRGVAAWLAEP